MLWLRNRKLHAYLGEMLAGATGIPMSRPSPWTGDALLDGYFNLESRASLHGIPNYWNRDQSL